MPSAIEMVGAARKSFSKHGAFDGLDSEAVADAFVATLEPYVTEDFSVRMVGVGDLRWDGIEGLRTGWRDFLEGFDHLRFVPGELQEAPEGDCVVEFVRMEGRPRGLDSEVDQQAAAVWRFRDGRLATVEFHIDRDAALRSAGLA